MEEKTDDEKTGVLKKQIEDCATELFGEDFGFREGQRSAIEAIVKNVIEKDEDEGKEEEKEKSSGAIKHTVLEAPTGSGKSTIAMVAAYVLHKCYDRRSYILVSDLSLFDQYVRDIDRTHSLAFGYIKGKENYICDVNGCKVSQSMCSLQNKSIMQLMYGKGGMRCAWSCEYVQDYVRAVKAPVTLMTYQMYFIQRNYVEDALTTKGENPNFPERDLVICDEAHKICDICQTHFAPRISIERPSWMKVIDAYMPMPSEVDEESRKAILEKIKASKTSGQLLMAMDKYMCYVKNYSDANEAIRKELKRRKRLSKRDKAALAAGNSARQEHCKLQDMSSLVHSIVKPMKCLVKTISDDGITFNFVHDDIMLKKFFHDKSDGELLMSATIGDFNEYASLTGLNTESCKGIIIPSAFDFSKSPILCATGNRMSMKEKAMSLPRIVQQTIKICEAHKGQRGIIQTGSYENSKRLREMLPKDILNRCIFYNENIEKHSALSAYIGKQDAILMGPTLIEGLNFPDDMCRFQICVKVPYAFLGSEYVREKMHNVAGWYRHDAIIKICQGIGRGVRHKHDWCRTYILDGCIQDLLDELENIPTLRGRIKNIGGDRPS